MKFLAHGLSYFENYAAARQAINLFDVTAAQTPPALHSLVSTLAGD